jgi:hypothetical protein
MNRALAFTVVAALLLPVPALAANSVTGAIAPGV